MILFWRWRGLDALGRAVFALKMVRLLFFLFLLHPKERKAKARLSDVLATE